MAIVTRQALHLPPAALVGVMALPCAAAVTVVLAVRVRLRSGFDTVPGPVVAGLTFAVAAAAVAHTVTLLWP
ncbi:hypothetical protein TSOC111612_06865 [Tsukamurella ocularis]